MNGQNCMRVTHICLVLLASQHGKKGECPPNITSCSEVRQSRGSPESTHVETKGLLSYVKLLKDLGHFPYQGAHKKGISLVC